MQLNQKTFNSTHLFDEVLNSVEVMGVQQTIKYLQKARTESLILKDVSIEFILNNVSEQTGVKIDRIIHGTDKTDERKAALSLSIFFVKEEFDYSLPELKRIFPKDKSSLSKYISLVNEIITSQSKIKSPFEKNIINLHKTIKSFIEQRKLQEKTN